MVWMYTFPAKMWIPALSQLQNLLQFHTQFNRDLPERDLTWTFMNLNQTPTAAASSVSWGPAAAPHRGGGSPAG